MPEDTEPHGDQLTYSETTDTVQNQVSKPIRSGAFFTALTEMKCSGHSNPAEMKTRSSVQVGGRRDGMRAF